MPFPVYIFDDLFERLKAFAEAEGTTVTDYARGKLYDLTEPRPKEFEPLLRIFYEQAKQFAVACAELPSVSAERKEEVKKNLTITLLDVIVSRKPDILAELGLIERLH